MSEDDRFYKTLVALELKDYKEGKMIMTLKDAIRNEFGRITKDYKNVIVIANSIGAFYAYEYLSDFSIKQAFFISPVASMLKLVMDIMNDNGISDKELEEKNIIRLNNNQTLSYEFYKHVSNYNDNWVVPTDILYGERDELVYIENIAEFLSNHPNARLTIKKGSEHYFHTEEEHDFIKNWILKSLG